MLYHGYSSTAVVAEVPRQLRFPHGGAYSTRGVLEYHARTGGWSIGYGVPTAEMHAHNSCSMPWVFSRRRLPILPLATPLHYNCRLCSGAAIGVTRER